MSRLDDCTIADARRCGFGLLGLYKLWCWNNCIPHGPWHDELDEKIRATQRELDERYQLLPLDADGEAIHIGDEMVVGDSRVIVDGVGVAGHTDIFFSIEGDKGDECEYFPVSVCHHYHKPTVEDVLREFGDEVRRCCDTEDTIAEYAKKLQLKEDE